MKKNRRQSRAIVRLKEIWRRFCKNRIALAGFIVFMCIMMVVVFADVIVPYEMTEKPSPPDRLTPPCAEHPFGTDNVNRDVFARRLYRFVRQLAGGRYPGHRLRLFRRQI